MSKSDELMNEQREAAMKLTKAEVVAKLEAAPRQFATTMARFPHSYTYIEKHGDYWTSEWDYDVMCTAINRWRKPRPFLHRTTWYFDANGRQYWLMPSPKTESGELVVAHRNLINIAPRWYDRPEVSIYEQPAFEYEKYAVYEKLRKEQFAALELRGRSVLDVGCGSGQMVDYAYWTVRPDKYVGIDPSASQLVHFQEKHPEYARSLIRTTFDEYVDVTSRKFDVIACMFGSASYAATDEAVERMKVMLRPGGCLHLMHYDLDHRDGVPTYYEKMGFAMSERTRELSFRSSELDAALEPDWADGALSCQLKGFVIRRWEKPE